MQNYLTDFVKKSETKTDRTVQFSFTWADYTVFALMLVISSFIGLYFGFKDYRKSREKTESDATNDEDMLNYLVGGRKMKIFPIGCSLVATWTSAIALFGTTGETYVFGAEYAIMLSGTIVLALVMHFVFLPVLHELKITSLHVYLQARFDKNTQILGSIMFTIQQFFWLTIVIYVPALALNQVTGIDEIQTCIVLSAVCIFYTFLGGLKAVVWTDLFQILITATVFLMIAIKGTHDIGGLSVLYDRNKASGRFDAPSFSADPTRRHSFWILTVGASFYWLSLNVVNQNIIQRYLSLPTLKATRIALWIHVSGVFYFIGISCFMGLLIHAYYFDCDPLTTGLAKTRDSLLSLFVIDIFGEYSGLSGLFIAGIFGACLSSLSTGLNSLSAVLMEDYIKNLVKKELTRLTTQIIMRGVVVIFGIIFVLMVLVVRNLGGVLQLTISLGGWTMGPLLGMFIIGMTMPWINAKSTCVAGICGVIFLFTVGIRAQLAIGNGELVFEPKPVSTGNCDYEWTNSTTSEKIDYYQGGEHISYMLYNFVGVLIVCTVGNICTFIFGRQDTKTLNPLLLAPFVRKFVNK